MCASVTECECVCMCECDARGAGRGGEWSSGAWPQDSSYYRSRTVNTGTEISIK